jgi:hypothetical protein
MSFISVMKKIGEDIKVAWEDVLKYLPAAAGLASLLFPGATGAVTGVVNAVGLIQQAVALVEQKFAATGINTQAGTQKLATVLSIVTPVVTELLNKEGITVDSTQITNIVNAVVAILNVSQATM